MMGKTSHDLHFFHKVLEKMHCWPIVWQYVTSATHVHFRSFAYRFGRTYLHAVRFNNFLFIHLICNSVKHRTLHVIVVPVSSNIAKFLTSVINQKYTTNIFRLFPIISISQNFFLFFFLTLEKIGIDEKVICYHNISN